VVLINMADQATVVPDVQGTLRLATDRARAGELVTGNWNWLRGRRHRGLNIGGP